MVFLYQHYILLLFFVVHICHLQNNVHNRNCDCLKLILCCNIFQEDTSNPNLKTTSVEDDKYSVVFWWCVGISILTVALLLSACMGIYQEVLYKKFGKRCPSVKWGVMRRSCFSAIKLDWFIMKMYFSLDSLDISP